MPNYPYHSQGKKGPDIPWEMIASHEKQADRNHGQTLRGLASRGGLCAIEMLAVLTDSRINLRLTEEEAVERLTELVAAWNKRVDTQESKK